MNKLLEELEKLMENNSVFFLDSEDGYYVKKDDLKKIVRKYKTLNCVLFKAIDDGKIEALKNEIDRVALNMFYQEERSIRTERVLAVKEMSTDHNSLIFYSGLDITKMTWNKVSDKGTPELTLKYCMDLVQAIF